MNGLKLNVRVENKDHRRSSHLHLQSILSMMSVSLSRFLAYVISHSQLADGSFTKRGLSLSLYLETARQFERRS